MTKKQIINKTFYRLPDVDESYMEELQDMYECIVEKACEVIKRHSATIESYGERLYGIDLEHFRKAMEE